MGLPILFYLFFSLFLSKILDGGHFFQYLIIDRHGMKSNDYSNNFLLNIA